MKKESFTLIELIIVMAMMSLLVAGIIPFLSNRTTRQRYQGENCFYQVSQQLDSFVNAALMGKKLRISSLPLREVYPAYYEIALHPRQNAISFNYRTGTNWVEYARINFTGACNQPGMYLEMTGVNFTHLVMNKGFRRIKPGERSAFYIS